MHREGHIGVALVVYAPLGFIAALIVGSEVAMYGAAVAVGLSMFPDIDMRIPLIKHRGITHTVWFALIVALIVGVIGVSIGSDAGPLAALVTGIFGFLVGMVSICAHLLADALTPTGVRPFAPKNDAHYTFNLARASNPIANYLLLGFGIGSCAIALRAWTLFV